MPSAPVIVRPCVLLMRMPAVAGSAQRSSAMARAVACRSLVGTVLRNIFRALGLSVYVRLSASDGDCGPGAFRLRGFRLFSFTSILYIGLKNLVLRFPCEFILPSLPHPF